MIRRNMSYSCDVGFKFGMSKFITNKHDQNVMNFKAV